MSIERKFVRPRLTSHALDDSFVMLKDVLNWGVRPCDLEAKLAAIASSLTKETFEKVRYIVENSSTGDEMIEFAQNLENRLEEVPCHMLLRHQIVPLLMNDKTYKNMVLLDHSSDITPVTITGGVSAIIFHASMIPETEWSRIDENDFDGMKEYRRKVAKDTTTAVVHVLEGDQYAQLYLPNKRRNKKPMEPVKSFQIVTAPNKGILPKFPPRMFSFGEDKDNLASIDFMPKSAASRALEISRNRKEG